MTETGARRIEWTIGLVSGLAVVVVLGLLVRAGIRDYDAHPDLSIELAAPGDEPEQIRFTLRNDGGLTARAVTVALALEGGEPSVHRVVVDYVPAHGEAQGGFTLPPGTSAGGATVEGYLDP